MRRVFLDLDESFSDIPREIVRTFFFRDESEYFLIKESRFLDTMDTDDDWSELDFHIVGMKKLVFRDNYLLLMHHHFPGVRSLHELTEILWYDLPPESESVIAPTTLYSLSILCKVIPVLIYLLLILTVDDEGKYIIELMMLLSCGHHRIPLPEYRHFCEFGVSARSLTKRHGIVEDEALSENRLIIVENCLDFSIVSVEPECGSDRISGHKIDSY